MSKYDQQMREMERALTQLSGSTTQAAQFRRKLTTSIQQIVAQARLDPVEAVQLQLGRPPHRIGPVRSRAGWSSEGEGE